MDSAAPDSRWGINEYILNSLSTRHPITERTIKASLPEAYQKQVEPALASMVEAGSVIQHGKRYVKYERA